MDAAALEALLSGGDRRSIGHVPEVIQEIEAQPGLFSALVQLLDSPDNLVRMRAADAAEKLTRAHPEWLQPHVAQIHAIARHARQQEVRWHVAPMLARIAWAPEIRRELAGILEAYLTDRSRIVQAEALQALVQLAAGDPQLEERACTRVQECSTAGPSAVRARARALLKRLPA